MKLKLLSALLMMLVLCTGCSGSADSSVPEYTEPEETYDLTVDFLKVGKADSAIIRTQNHTVVIDCGEKTDGKKVRNCMNTIGADTIDYMILTHYDQDHIGGAKKVINEFTVEHILAPYYSEESKEYSNLTDAVAEHDVDVDLLTSSVVTFTLDDAYFEVYPCQKKSYQDGDDNNHSLIVRITHHDQVFLFTGDAMQERLTEIMNIGDCDVLKEPYHGREIANLGEFLDQITPEYAVVSTDEENYSDLTAQALADRNIQTYVTFQNGNIRCISTGSTVSFETGLNFKGDSADE